MIEAMKQALEVIETAIKAGDWKVDGACDPDNVIHGLRQAIADLESQEPVCEWCDGTGMVDSGGTQPWGEAINIPCGCQHTHPPQRTWVGLTDEEIYTESRSHEKWAKDGSEWFSRGSFARAIEAKLKERNT